MVQQEIKGGRYLIRGFFATTLGIMWLIAAKQIAPLTPDLFIAILSMALGAEMVGISLVRERARRSAS